MSCAGGSSLTKIGISPVSIRGRKRPKFRISLLSRLHAARLLSMANISGRTIARKTRSFHSLFRIERRMSTVAALTQSDYPGRWWIMLQDGRIECRLCPRFCKLNDGQRGFCFVRQRASDRMVLTTYGRSSGFCVDPIEKKPLNHFLPGTSVLSFGTAGCNLGCRFCQNWDISKAREWDKLADAASPEQIALAAERLGCRSVAFTYNDPVIFAEYAIDRASDWFMENLGPDVPWHFTAFHPDFKMLDKPHTPASTLTRAREIARSKGLHYIYTGNVHDREGGSTWCPSCGELLIERDWYELGDWNLENGQCQSC